MKVLKMLNVNEIVVSEYLMVKFVCWKFLKWWKNGEKEGKGFFKKFKKLKKGKKK